MMAKHTKSIDWDLKTRFEARKIVTALGKTLPWGWGAAVEMLAVHPVEEPIWLRARGWLDRLEDFKKRHGDALGWNLSDFEVIKKAREIALWVDQLVELKSADTCDEEKLDKVCKICDLVGVDRPVALTALGAVNRALDERWWRRVIRCKVARVVEAAAIKLGRVSRDTGGYASDSAIKRRCEQKARNAAMLEKTLMRNEAGQVFSLSELAKKSTANPEIRGGELMTRIRGCEEYATASGHVGYFLTGTCPSKFHAVQISGKGRGAVVRPNPKYDGVSTPRDAQKWLRDQWAKTRAQWARDGVHAYGFRVAEPHHDGCPHWHMLIWFMDDHEARKALTAYGEKWLCDGGGVVAYPSRENVLVFAAADGSRHEAGALKNRVNIKRMKKGGAAGYVAKYIAKSIGHFDVGTQLDTVDGATWELDTRAVKGWQRVDAWAATWGIRQFQAIGQPPVTVWREMRRVTKDQINAAIHGGDQIASKVWHAVTKFGDVGADWCRYMVHMGGAAMSRGQYAVKTALRVEPDFVNGYGEAVGKKTIIGCALKSGRVLVSRRQSWVHVGADVLVQESKEREALGAPWTGFNNCTARLAGAMRGAMMAMAKGARDEGEGYLWT